MAENRGQREVSGTVIEALPDTFFRVKFDDETEHLAYLAGRMRYNRIRVMVGDKVRVALDPYGGKSKIVRRL